MSKRNIVFEGRSKILYEGPTPGTLIQHFKDNIRMPKIDDQSNAPIIFGKGVLNNRISAYLMTQLDEMGLPTHFIKAMNMREQLVWDIEMLPFDIVVRNLAAKDMSERLGVDEGSSLPRSIVEFTLKSEKKNYPLISDEHIIAFGWATQDELEDIYTMSMRANDFLSGLFLGVGLKLVDVRLEFGRMHFENDAFVILGDEISPDNCRLWPLNANKEVESKDFGKDMNQNIDDFQDIAKRLGILPEGTITPDTPVSMELLEKLKTSDEYKPIKPAPVKK